MESKKQVKEVTPAQIDKGLKIADALKEPDLLQLAIKLRDEAKAPTTLGTHRAVLMNDATFHMLAEIAHTNREIRDELVRLNGGK